MHPTRFHAVTGITRPIDAHADIFHLPTATPPRLRTLPDEKIGKSDFFPKRFRIGSVKSASILSMSVRLVIGPPGRLCEAVQGLSFDTGSVIDVNAIDALLHDAMARCASIDTEPIF